MRLWLNITPPSCVCLSRFAPPTKGRPAVHMRMVPSGEFDEAWLQICVNMGAERVGISAMALHQRRAEGGWCGALQAIQQGKKRSGHPEFSASWQSSPQVCSKRND
jgi:hypothetical protein